MKKPTEDAWIIALLHKLKAEVGEDADPVSAIDLVLENLELSAKSQVNSTSQKSPYLH